VSFSDLSIDKAATGYSLSASSSGLTGSTSGAFNINPGTAAKLVFITQPANTNAGSVINGPPNVAVQDSFGNTVSSAFAAVRMSIAGNPGAATLGGTTTRSTSSGVVNFTDLTIDQPGYGYTLTASATGLAVATSSSLNVSAANTATLVVSKIGSGTVTSSPGGINCGATCSATLDRNTVVVFTATPASGFTFGGWSGNADCSDGVVTMNINKVCTAVFNSGSSNIVTITSPASGTVINSSTVIVRGVVDVPTGTHVGVTVNGVVAAVYNGFFAVQVPVAPDTTSLMAVATLAQGITSSNSVSVSVSTTPDPEVLLYVSPRGGQAPLIVQYTIISDVVATQVELDVDGDGTFDFTGPSLEGLQFILTEPGVYVSTVRLTDFQGNHFTANAVIQVYDPAALDAVLLILWNDMKDALRNGDITGAGNQIVSESRDKYVEAFQIIAAQLPNIDQILTNISFVRMEGNSAIYEMVRMVQGLQTSFEVQFVRDSDGIWRVDSF
jgi:hypothetical protein